ncbi:MAG: hypothetical protein ACTSU9_19805 [Promethearchaeota archaeon]
MKASRNPDKFDYSPPGCTIMEEGSLEERITTSPGNGGGKPPRTEHPSTQPWWPCNVNG